MIQSTYTNVIVKVHYIRQLTDRLVLADGYVKQKGERFGEVVSIGKDNMLGLSLGDKVLFSHNEGMPIIDNGEEYMSLKQDYIEAVIK